MKHFEILALSLEQANEATARLSPVLNPLTGHLASIGVKRSDTGRIIGVSSLAALRSESGADSVSVDIVRLVYDHTRGAAAYLVKASQELAWNHGFLRIQHYAMAEFSGRAFRDAGWRMECRLSPRDLSREAPDLPENEGTGPRARWAAFNPHCGDVDLLSLEAAFAHGEGSRKAKRDAESCPFDADTQDELRAVWREGWAIAA